MLIFDGQRILCYLSIFQCLLTSHAGTSFNFTVLLFCSFLFSFLLMLILRDSTIYGFFLFKLSCTGTFAPRGEKTRMFRNPKSLKSVHNIPINCYKLRLFDVRTKQKKQQRSKLWTGSPDLSGLQCGVLDFNYDKHNYSKSFNTEPRLQLRPAISTCFREALPSCRSLSCRYHSVTKMTSTGCQQGESHDPTNGFCFLLWP